jgi:hypothetical protein
VLIRGCDLQDLDASLLDEAEEAGSIAAGRFDADALNLPEGSHPGEHLPVSLAGCGKASGSQNAILFINDCRDMQILVGVHAAHDVTPCSVFHAHSKSPGSCFDGFARTECADRTVT